jgi:hypothetical protein
LGLTRGKNDKIDAERICLFTEKIILNYQSGSQFRSCKRLKYTIEKGLPELK